MQVHILYQRSYCKHEFNDIDVIEIFRDFNKAEEKKQSLEKILEGKEHYTEISYFIETYEVTE